MGGVDAPALCTFRFDGIQFPITRLPPPVPVADPFSLARHRWQIVQDCGTFGSLARSQKSMAPIINFSIEEGVGHGHEGWATPERLIGLLLPN